MSGRGLRQGLRDGHQDFSGLGVAAELLLAEHAAVVDIDLEHATAGRDDDKPRDVLVIGLEQFGCQTGSSVAVASDGAVLDADAHGAPSWTEPHRARRRQWLGTGS